MLVQGPTEQYILEQAVKQRLPVPQKIENAPDLFLGLGLYYTAFWELTTCRSLGASGIGPISWLSIQQYATMMGFDEDQTEELHFYVASMDATYVKHVTKPKGTTSNGKDDDGAIRGKNG